MSAAPQSVMVETCDTCKQPWATHVASSKRRANQEFRDLIEDGDHDSTDGIPPVVPVIDFRDCVLALQEANRGPMGYVGPAGPAGMDAR